MRAYKIEERCVTKDGAEFTSVEEVEKYAETIIKDSFVRLLESANLNRPAVGLSHADITAIVEVMYAGRSSILDALLYEQYGNDDET